MKKSNEYHTFFESDDMKKSDKETWSFNTADVPDEIRLIKQESRDHILEKFEQSPRTQKFIALAEEYCMDNLKFWTNHTILGIKSTSERIRGLNKVVSSAHRLIANIEDINGHSELMIDRQLNHFQRAATFRCPDSLSDLSKELVYLRIAAETSSSWLSERHTPKRGRPPNYYLRLFVEGMVQAYFEAYEEHPSPSKNATKQDFHGLVRELAEDLQYIQTQAQRCGEEQTDLERYIERAIEKSETAEKNRT